MQTEVGCDSPAAFRERIPLSLSLNGTGHGMNYGFDRETRSFQNGIVASSPDTSGSSTPVHVSRMSLSSADEAPDDQFEEIDLFMKEYVSWLFDSECEISYENKAKFGELMKDSSARLSFAKYIDAHRSHMKCVDETTFYKLVHSFALVLFECGEADDYLPGKSLMNMAFTYCYVPDQRMVSAESFGSGETSFPSSGKRAQRSNGRAKSDSDDILPKKKSLMQRVKKDFEACKQIFQDTPSFNELKQGIWRRKPSRTKSENEGDDASSGYSRSMSDGFVLDHSGVFSPKEKNYLYEHLRNQVIWKSLRFWNETFFTAVHDERRRRCIQKDWSDLSPDEQESTDDAIVNITFGQLGTFINNMKCLGLSQKTCFEFLRKQSVIGGIEEGGQYYQMLVEQIEDDCTF